MPKVSSEIQHHLSQLMTTEAELPIGCLATVTKVDMSPDLKTAHAYITVLPETKDKEVITALRRAARHLQKN